MMDDFQHRLDTDCRSWFDTTDFTSSPLSGFRRWKLNKEGVTLQWKIWFKKLNKVLLSDTLEVSLLGNYAKKYVGFSLHSFTFNLQPLNKLIATTINISSDFRKAGVEISSNDLCQKQKHFHNFFCLTVCRAFVSWPTSLPRSWQTGGNAHGHFPSGSAQPGWWGRWSAPSTDDSLQSAEPTSAVSLPETSTDTLDVMTDILI